LTTLLDAWEQESTGSANPGGRVISAGVNRVNIYELAIRSSSGGEQVTAVSYGNRPMTVIETSLTAGAGADIHSSAWLIKDADIALAENTNYTITRSPNVLGVVYRARSATYAGVDQTDPILDSFSAQGLGGATPTGEALTTQSGAHVIATHKGADQNTTTQDVTWNNLTEQLESTNNQIYSSVAQAVGTGADLTPSVTPVNNVHTILQGFSLRNVATVVEVDLGQTTETDSSLAVAPSAAVALGTPSEADTALPVAPAITVALGQASGADEALTVLASAFVTYGRSDGIEVALSVTINPVFAICVETDLALPIVPNVISEFVPDFIVTVAGGPVNFHVTGAGPLSIIVQGD
jgi:hypothetical protein